MHRSMCRVQSGPFVYYTCRRLPVRHAFTTKYGGVSTGHCESLNLGFSRGTRRPACGKITAAWRKRSAWMKNASR